jgi:hypothetical protein
LARLAHFSRVNDERDTESRKELLRKLSES